jgi:hypothetical protein
MRHRLSDLNGNEINDPLNSFEEVNLKDDILRGIFASEEIDSGISELQKAN